MFLVDVKGGLQRGHAVVLSYAKDRYGGVVAFTPIHRRESDVLALAAVTARGVWWCVMVCDGLM